MLMSSILTEYYILSLVENEAKFNKLAIYYIKIRYMNNLMK